MSNNPGWRHLQEEVAVLVSLLLSVALLVAGVVGLWLWKGSGLSGGLPA